MSKPFVSDYATFGNNPIYFVDPNGADWYKNKKSGDIEYKADWHKKHKGYQSLGKGNGDWLSNEGKDYNKKTGEVSTTLESVTVTTTRKTSLADRAGALNWANNTGSSKVWREDYWNYRSDGTNTGLNPDKIKMYDRWIQADKDYRAMSLGAVGIIAAPIVVMGAIETGVAGLIYQGGSWAVRRYGVDFANELAKNILANRGNIKKIDFNDVIVNTATARWNIFGKVVAKTWNSAVDVNYSDGTVSLFNGRKSWANAGIDAGFNYLKLGTKSLAQPGQDKDAVNVFEILVDQLKKGLKDGATQ